MCRRRVRGMPPASLVGLRSLLDLSCAQDGIGNLADLAAQLASLRTPSWMIHSCSSSLQPYLPIGNCASEACVGAAAAGFRCGSLPISRRTSAQQVSRWRADRSAFPEVVLAGAGERPMDPAAKQRRMEQALRENAMLSLAGVLPTGPAEGSEAAQAPPLRKGQSRPSLR